jgi:hypothetical protein
MALPFRDPFYGSPWVQNFGSVFFPFIRYDSSKKTILPHFAVFSTQTSLILLKECEFSPKGLDFSKKEGKILAWS